MILIIVFAVLIALSVIIVIIYKKIIRSETQEMGDSKINELVTNYMKFQELQDEGNSNKKI